MEWTESLKRAIRFIEGRLLEDINAVTIANEVHISSFYFQKGFTIMTGYTIGEYIRCRRLYLAALDVIAGKEKIIDLAYKYCYDTPESFTKAFSRFHGVSPKQLKGDISKIKTFLPLKITVSIKGGNIMDYVVEKMGAMKMIGYEKNISYENPYDEIPKFWYESFQSNAHERDEEMQQVFRECKVGEFALCIEKEQNQKEFRYMIAGLYNGSNVPEGMTVLEIPACEWAKFNCTGPLPGALQSVNTQIFSEWLPGNPEFEIAFGIHAEWYSLADGSAADYKSQIWIPVKRK